MWDLFVLERYLNDKQIKAGASGIGKEEPLSEELSFPLGSISTVVFQSEDFAIELMATKERTK